MNKTIKWIPQNWYEIVYSEEQENLIFQFITMTSEGKHTIKLCDGHVETKLLDLPYIQIINHGIKCPCT